MSREQMATFIYKYAGAPAVTGGLTYSDKAGVSSWAVNAVNYCTAQSYMSGVSGVFAPGGTANRAMGAVTLMKLAQAAKTAATK